MVQRPREKEDGFGQILWWILGALWGLLVLVGGALHSYQASRIARIENFQDQVGHTFASQREFERLLKRLDTIEAKIDAVNRKVIKRP